MTKRFFAWALKAVAVTCFLFTIVFILSIFDNAALTAGQAVILAAVNGAIAAICGFASKKMEAKNENDNT